MFQKTTEKVWEMTEKIKSQMESLDEDFAEHTAKLFDDAKRDLAYNKKPFKPIDLTYDAGSSIGVDGTLLQPNAWEMLDKGNDPTNI